MDEFLSLLRTSGQRLTEPRKQIYKALKSQTTPVTVAMLARQCKDVDRTSVYRTLELFDSLGIVTTTYRGWKRTYELSAPFNPHHHHFCCIKCHSFIDIHSDELETLVARMAHDHQVEIISHVFEGNVICTKCRQNNALLAHDI